MAEQNDTPGMGHNQPPRPLTFEELRDKLSTEYADIIKRARELLESCERMPEAVADDATAGKFSDQVALLQTCIKKAEGARKDEKQYFLDGGSVVDAFFNDVKDKLLSAKKSIENDLTTYQLEKERKERERLAAEAEELRKKREAAQAEGNVDEAVAAGEAEHAAETAARTGTPDMARTRGEYGSTATLKKTWDFEIEDYAKIPLAQLRPYLTRADVEKAIRGYVRAGGRELKGVKIFQTAKTQIRG